MHKYEIEVGFGIKWKIFSCLAAILVFLIGVRGIIGFYHEEKLYHIFVVGIPAILFSFYAPLYALKFRIRLTDSHLEKIAFGSVRLAYDQVDSIKFFDDKVVVMRKKLKIAITRDIQNQEQLIREVISKVKNNPNLALLGNNRVKGIYFPEAVTSD